MKNLYLIIFLAVSVCFASCTNPYEKEIKEVEEMQILLTGIKQSYQTIDVEKVTFAKESYDKNMLQIQTYYMPDTIDQKVVYLLDFYKGVKKSAKGFEEEYKQIGERIIFLDNQLGNLKTDLENNIDMKDSLSIFLSNEHKNLEVLQQNMGTILYNYDFIVNVHDTISSKVQSIIIKNVE